MNPAHAIHYLVRILTTTLATLLACAAAPAALANPRPRGPGWNKHPPLPANPQPALRYPPGWNKHPPLPAHAHALSTGGLPGWQITLIAAATVLAFVVVVLLARARVARQRTATRPA